MRLTAYIIALVLSICVFIIAIRILIQDRKHNAKTPNGNKKSEDGSQNKLSLFGIEINTQSISVLLILVALATPIILLKFIDFDPWHGESTTNNPKPVSNNEVAEKRLIDLKGEAHEIVNKKEKYLSIVDYKTDSTFNDMQVKALEDSLAKNLFK